MCIGEGKVIAEELKLLVPATSFSRTADGTGAKARGRRGRSQVGTTPSVLHRRDAAARHDHNYFLNHWIPNFRGTSMDKKRAEFGARAGGARPVIIVDPRRTVTMNACEVEAGKDRVMHLAINSGTDLALFNAWLTYIADKGWTDKAFVAASTKDFDKALTANRTSLEGQRESRACRLIKFRQSADWIAQPKSGGTRRRTMFAYEKGLIWGNDNYRTNAALVKSALATGTSAGQGAAVFAWAVIKRATHGDLMPLSGPRALRR